MCMWIIELNSAFIHKARRDNQSAVQVQINKRT